MFLNITLKISKQVGNRFKPALFCILSTTGTFESYHNTLSISGDLKSRKIPSRRVVTGTPGYKITADIESGLKVVSYPQI